MTSNIHKSPERTKILEDISNYSKKESKIIDFLNNIKTYSEGQKAYDAKTNNLNAKDSNHETCQRETQEENEGYSEQVQLEETIKSSQITDSYKSFSTMNNERSQSIDNDSCLQLRCLQTKCMRNLLI